jgi:hypothetical protein
VAGALLQAVRADKLTFSGSDVDATSFDVFWVNYTALCNTYNSSQVARKIVLPNLLRGAAFAFYTDLDDAVQNDYVVLCDALRAKFDSKEYSQRCLDRLSTLQQSGDSVSAFAQRVRTLGRSALGKLTGPVYDKLLTQYFRNGLHPSIQMKMEDQPVSLSFEETTSLANRFPYNMSRRQNPESVHTSPVSQMVYGVRPVNRPHLAGRGQGPFCSTPSGPPVPGVPAGRPFTDHPGNRPQSRWQRRDGGQVDQPAVGCTTVLANLWCPLCRSRPCTCSTAATSGTSTSSPRTVVCYNCQKAGHFSRDCRSPRAATSGQTSRPVAAVQKVTMPSATVTAGLEFLRRDKAELSAQNLRLIKSIRELFAPCL